MSKPISYKRHRFPPEIIAHAVWLYFRFPLSLRLVEELLLERGIVLSYETVQRWALKFGQLTLAVSGARHQAAVTFGTWMRSWPRSLARSTGCGGPWIRTDTCSMRSSRRAATPRRPNAC
jgi:hypothetical protein